jgi:hypothetical protein
MLRHFKSANGLEGVGEALGFADGIGLAAAEAVGVGAGMFGEALLDCGTGAAE